MEQGLTSLLLLLLVLSLFYRPASLYHPQRHDHRALSYTRTHQWLASLTSVPTNRRTDFSEGFYLLKEVYYVQYPALAERRKLGFLFFYKYFVSVAYWQNLLRHGFDSQRPKYLI